MERKSKSITKEDLIMKKMEDYTDKELDKCIDNLDIKWSKKEIEDDKETVESINTSNFYKSEIRKILINDIKKDTKALYYAFKYLNPELNILTIEFLFHKWKSNQLSVEHDRLMGLFGICIRFICINVVFIGVISTVC